MAVEFAGVRQKIGKGGNKLVPEVAGVNAQSEMGKQIGMRRGEIFTAEYLPTLRPFPGEQDLHARMRRQGLELAVASSSEGEELEKPFRVRRTGEFNKASTSSDDVEDSKPDPDTVHAAHDRLGHTPRAILLGDTAYEWRRPESPASGRSPCPAAGGRRRPERGGPADLLARFDRRHSPAGRLTA